MPLIEQKTRLTLEVAIGMAFTAAGTRLPTRDSAQSAAAGGPAFGTNISHQRKFMIVGGALPIKLPSGETIDGIGCSSGSWQQDGSVAHAGIDALLQSLGESHTR